MGYKLLIPTLSVKLFFFSFSKTVLPLYSHKQINALKVNEKKKKNNNKNLPKPTNGLEVVWIGDGCGGEKNFFFFFNS